MQYYPKLVCFDLDGCCWEPEMYMCAGPPFKKDKNNKVYCSDGEEIELLGDTKDILNELATAEHFKNTKVAYVSRTRYISGLATCLQLIDINNAINMNQIAQYKEIYPKNKQIHFNKLQQLTNIDFKDMIFFDNQMDNIHSVGQLGVHCVYTPQGMTLKHFQKGLQLYNDYKIKKIEQ